MKKIGSKTRWGTIKAIAWLGERYYFMVDKDHTVAMMPASTVEVSPKAGGKKI